MNISGSWSKPIPLKKSRSGLGFDCPTVEIPAVAGVYVFARKFGRSFEAIYVGKAGRLSGRIKQQFNNHRLMEALVGASSGARVLFYCPLDRRPNQNVANLLATTERALIQHFLLSGHEIVNDKGTRPKTHRIEFSGNRDSESLLGTRVLLPKA